MTEELTSAGLKASTKDSTDRLTRMFNTLQSERRNAYDSTPNRFARSQTERKSLEKGDAQCPRG